MNAELADRLVRIDPGPCRGSSGEARDGCGAPYGQPHKPGCWAAPRLDDYVGGDRGDPRAAA